jgi:hypothetical protein
VLISLAFDPHCHLVPQHFLLKDHQVGPLEDVKPDVHGVQVRGVKESFLVAAEEGLGLEVVVAGPAFQQVELLGKSHSLGVGHLFDVLEADEHVLLHDHFLPQADLVSLRCQHARLHCLGA